MSWKANPVLCIQYLPWVKKLILYRENFGDDYSAMHMRCNFPIETDDAFQAVGGSMDLPITRLLLLRFFDELDLSQLECSAVELQSAIDTIIIDLLKLNMSQVYEVSSPYGSKEFCEKLRCWQSLCILSRHLSSSRHSEAGDLCLKALKQTCGYAIRVHMEVFAATLICSEPESMLKSLLSEFGAFNIPIQVNLRYSKFIALYLFRRLLHIS
jgi:hypothetical protein